MKNKYYLMIRNNLSGLMETVATFNALGDACRCCTLFNNDLKEINDSTREYGVSDNPMIWSYKYV